jgi:hypothetical protein
MVLLRKDYILLILYWYLSDSLLAVGWLSSVQAKINKKDAWAENFFFRRASFFFNIK